MLIKTNILDILVYFLKQFFRMEELFNKIGDFIFNYWSNQYVLIKTNIFDINNIGYKYLLLSVAIRVYLYLKKK